MEITKRKYLRHIVQTIYGTNCTGRSAVYCRSNNCGLLLLIVFRIKRNFLSHIAPLHCGLHIWSSMSESRTKISTNSLVTKCVLYIDIFTIGAT